MSDVNEIKEIDISKVNSLISRARKDWLVLKFKNPLNVDPMEFLNQINELAKEKQFRYKDNRAYGEHYSGISLQKNIINDLVTEPDYDSLDASTFSSEFDFVAKKTVYFTPKGWTYDEAWEKKKDPEIIDMSDKPNLKQMWDLKITKKQTTSYFVLNDWAHLFKDVLSDFCSRKLSLYYGRLLESEPNLVSRIHTDGDTRLHIPIYTNENCVTEFYDSTGKKLLRKYHMPADGYFYLFNGRVPHKFYNLGDQPRLHTIFLITYENRWPKLFKSYDDCLNNIKKANNL